MKIVKILAGMLFASSMVTMNAQTDTATTGKLNTTTIKTFNYDKEGTKIPYKVTIQEQRVYKASFQQSTKNMENWERKNEPAQVSKLITINSAVDNNLDRILVLRYEKQLADTFELVQTDKGFAVEVDGKSLEYIIGEGIYFANTADKDFFVVDEFIMVL